MRSMQPISIPGLLQRLTWTVPALYRWTLLEHERLIHEPQNQGELSISERIFLLREWELEINVRTVLSVVAYDNPCIPDPRDLRDLSARKYHQYNYLDALTDFFSLRGTTVQKLSLMRGENAWERFGYRSGKPFTLTDLLKECFQIDHFHLNAIWDQLVHKPKEPDLWWKVPMEEVEEYEMEKLFIGSTAEKIDLI